MQETLIRLTDAAILVAGRVVETTGWPNRSSLTLPSTFAYLTALCFKQQTDPLVHLHRLGGTNGISSDSEKSQTSREEKLESSRSSLTPSPAHDVRFVALPILFALPSSEADILPFYFHAR